MQGKKRSPWDARVLRTWVGKVIPAHRHGVRYKAKIIHIEIRGLYVIITYRWIAWRGRGSTWHPFSRDDTDVPNPFVVLTTWHLWSPLTETILHFDNIEDGHA